MLATKKSLTLAAAKAIAAAAEAEAAKNNWNVVIAILDDGANLVYLQRMDGTQIGSIEVAQQKGACAIRFKRPSKAFAEMVNGGTPGMMALRGVVPVEGGLPLTVNGQIVGAIGVSGVKSDQDGIVAKAGADLAAGLS
jgi:uncharacterized protein GlcG (DUF336 family)